MKITKSRLQQIIKEEIQRALVIRETVTKDSARKAINKARKTLKTPMWRKLRRLAYKNPEAAMEKLQAALGTDSAAYSKDKPFGTVGDVDPAMATLGRKKARPVEKIPAPGGKQVANKGKEQYVPPVSDTEITVGGLGRKKARSVEKIPVPVSRRQAAINAKHAKADAAQTSGVSDVSMGDARKNRLANDDARGMANAVNKGLKKLGIDTDDKETADSP